MESVRFSSPSSSQKVKVHRSGSIEISTLGGTRFSDGVSASASAASAAAASAAVTAAAPAPSTSRSSALDAELQELGEQLDRKFERTRQLIRGGIPGDREPAPSSDTVGFDFTDNMQDVALREADIQMKHLEDTFSEFDSAATAAILVAENEMHKTLVAEQHLRMYAESGGGYQLEHSISSTKARRKGREEARVDRNRDSYDGRSNNGDGEDDDCDKDIAQYGNHGTFQDRALSPSQRAARSVALAASKVAMKINPSSEQQQAQGTQVQMEEKELAPAPFLRASGMAPYSPAPVRPPPAWSTARRAGNGGRQTTLSWNLHQGMGPFSTISSERALRLEDISNARELSLSRDRERNIEYASGGHLEAMMQRFRTSPEKLGVRDAAELRRLAQARDEGAAARARQAAEQHALAMRSHMHESMAQTKELGLSVSVAARESAKKARDAVYSGARLRVAKEEKSSAAEPLVSPTRARSSMLAQKKNIHDSLRASIHDEAGSAPIARKLMASIDLRQAERELYGGKEGQSTRDISGGDISVGVASPNTLKTPSRADPAMRHRPAAGISLSSGSPAPTANAVSRKAARPKIPGSYKHYPTPSTGKAKIFADVPEYAESAASAKAAEGFHFNKIVMAPEPAALPQTPRCAANGAHGREMAGSKVHRVGPRKEEDYPRGLSSFRTVEARDTGNGVGGSPSRSRYKAPPTPSTRAPPPTMGGDNALVASSLSVPSRVAALGTAAGPTKATKINGEEGSHVHPLHPWTPSNQRSTRAAIGKAGRASELLHADAIKEQRKAELQATQERIERGARLSHQAFSKPKVPNMKGLSASLRDYRISGARLESDILTNSFAVGSAEAPTSVKVHRSGSIEIQRGESRKTAISTDNPLLQEVSLAPRRPEIVAKAAADNILLATAKPLAESCRNPLL